MLHISDVRSTMRNAISAPDFWGAVSTSRKTAPSTSAQTGYPKPELFEHICNFCSSPKLRLLQWFLASLAQSNPTPVYSNSWNRSQTQHLGSCSLSIIMNSLRLSLNHSSSFPDIITRNWSIAPSLWWNFTTLPLPHPSTHILMHHWQPV